MDAEWILTSQLASNSRPLKELEDYLATVVNAAGQSGRAAQLFWRAPALDPTSPSPAFDAGLAFAEAGNPIRAIRERDLPH